MAAASRPPRTSSYRRIARQKWSKYFERRRPAMIRASTAEYARSMAFTPLTVPNGGGPVFAGPGVFSAGPGWLTQTAEGIVAAAPPRALAAVREEGEAADREAGREAGQILEDG